MDFNFLWVLSVVLVLAGVAGTLLPLLPGTLLVWAGLLLGMEAKVVLSFVMVGVFLVALWV